MTIKTNDAEFIGAIVSAAANNPDYVYDLPKCRYFVGDKPACIIGVALASLGAKAKDFFNFTLGEDSFTFNTDGVSSLEDTGILTGVSDIALNFAETVQIAQDGSPIIPNSRKSWSDAVAMGFESTYN